MKLNWKLAYVSSIFVDLKLNFRVLISGIYIWNRIIRKLFHLLQGRCHICSIHWEWRNWERSGHIVRSHNEACNFRWTGTLCCTVKLASLYKTQVHAQTNHVLSRSLTNVLEVFLYAYKEFHFIKILTKWILQIFLTNIFLNKYFSYQIYLFPLLHYSCNSICLYTLCWFLFYTIPVMMFVDRLITVEWRWPLIWRTLNQVHNQTYSWQSWFMRYASFCPNSNVLVL